MRFPSRRWRLCLLAALLLVGAVALGCALALGPGSKLTEANFEKIQMGMTIAQVDEILGAENQGPCVSWGGTRTQVYCDEDLDVAISVTLDTHNGDRVTDKKFRRFARTLGDFLLSRLAKVRRRLGL